MPKKVNCIWQIRDQTIPHDTPFERVYESMFLEMARQENKRKSMALREAFALRGKSGHFRTSPYGYDLRPDVPRTESNLIRNEAELKVLIEIILPRVQKMNADCSISRELNRAGIPYRDGRPWKECYIRFIRANWVWCYAGVFRSCLTHREKDPESGIKVIRRVPLEEVQIHEDPALAIISNETAASIERGNSRNENMSRHQGTFLLKHWLSGVLRCPICGSAFTYRHGHRNVHRPEDRASNPQWAYYHCTRRAKEARCSKVRLHARSVEAAVLEHLRDAFSPGTMESFDRAIFERFEGKQGPERQRLNTRQAEISQELPRLVELAKRVDGVEEIAGDIVKLKEERAAIERELQRMSRFPGTNLDTWLASVQKASQGSRETLNQWAAMEPAEQKHAARSCLEKLYPKDDFNVQAALSLMALKRALGIDLTCDSTGDGLGPLRTSCPEVQAWLQTKIIRLQVRPVGTVERAEFVLRYHARRGAALQVSELADLLIAQAFYGTERREWLINRLSISLSRWHRSGRRFERVEKGRYQLRDETSPAGAA